MTISLRAYQINLNQRRFENSFKILEMFNLNLNDDDIDNIWKEIFEGGFAATGTVSEDFLFGNQIYSFIDLFTEGAPDNGAIPRILGQLELICIEVELGTVELRIIYSNIGQIMEHLFNYLLKHEDIKQGYPNFIRVMTKNKSKLGKWEYRIIARCE